MLRPQGCCASRGSSELALAEYVQDLPQLPYTVTFASSQAQQSPASARAACTHLWQSLNNCNVAIIQQHMHLLL